MKNTRFLVYAVFIFFILSSSLISISAKKKHRKHGPPPAPGDAPPAPGDAKNSNSNSKIFSVTNYGAKGDGQTDDTTAFENAWAAACKADGSTMMVPGGNTFKLKPIRFAGKCQSSIVFQLDGEVISSTNAGDWKSGLLQWLDFTGLSGLTIQGTGKIDGQGDNWWSGKLSGKPTALRIADSSGVTVTGITIQNSQQAHLKFDNCDGVAVDNVKINSPGDSPNTDGIHLQNTKHVTIQNTDISAGDDAISIQTGCSGVEIFKVTCGPSHGISIGSLGKNGATATVSDINVHDCIIKDSDNGVRIKTWPSGSGTVTGVTFKNIQVTDVKTPIVIDQNYGQDASTQSSSGSGVDIHDITYASIAGTYKFLPVSLSCSNSQPCSGLDLSNINLRPSGGGASSASCSNAYGTQENDGTMKCLQSRNP